MQEIDIIFILQCRCLWVSYLLYTNKQVKVKDLKQILGYLKVKFWEVYKTKINAYSQLKTLLKNEYFKQYGIRIRIKLQCHCFNKIIGSMDRIKIPDLTLKIVFDIQHP